MDYLKLMNCSGKGFSYSFKTIVSDDVLSNLNWEGRHNKRSMCHMKIFGNILFGNE